MIMELLLLLAVVAFLEFRGVHFGSQVLTERKERDGGEVEELSMVGLAAVLKM